MRKFVFVLAFLLGSLPCFSQDGNAIASGVRSQINSEVLQESRAYQVYLPPSYNVYASSSYPVLYLIDGDYNFHYVTGLVELMCDISEEIPEMIVVGVADGGSEKYADQCNPSIGEKAGKGKDLIAFFENELMPSINKNYRTSGFDILQGHSRGGLFTTYAAVEKPDLFDVYHAISPALWWQDYALLKHAKTKLSGLDKLPFRLFMTLGDEKEMGVNRFAQHMKEQFPNDANFKYTLFENENHGSVGLPSITLMLKELFGEFKMTRAKFVSFETPEAFADHYAQIEKTFLYKQPIPANRLGDAIHYYFSRDKTEELDRLKAAVKKHSKTSLTLFNYYLGSFHEGKENFTEASKSYHLGIYINPNVYENYLGVASLAQRQGQDEKANKFFRQALTIAKNTKARQWMLNEIKSKMK